MAATVAHEVRNPLNTVHMAATRLRREFTVDPSDQAEFAELVDVLLSESERVERVVTDFLELGRPLKLVYESVDATSLLHSVIQAQSLRAATAQVQLACRIDAEVHINGDRRRLNQLLQNLVSNAIDACSDKIEAQVELSVHQLNNDQICIVVQDNGAGIDAETLKLVQREFFTTRARGTGLGLPLARRLSQAHGGELTIESSVGQGTRVSVSLPYKTIA
jgi:signal transduction histidine kinase